jgi:hypothetical protein
MFGIVHRVASTSAFFKISGTTNALPSQTFWYRGLPVKLSGNADLFPLNLFGAAKNLPSQTFSYSEPPTCQFFGITDPFPKIIS